MAAVTPFAGDPDLTLDTSDLAAVYLGAFTFADLARAGRVGECRPGAVAAADRAVRHGRGAVVLDDVLGVQPEPSTYRRRPWKPGRGQAASRDLMPR